MPALKKRGVMDYGKYGHQYSYVLGVWQDTMNRVEYVTLGGVTSTNIYNAAIMDWHSDVNILKIKRHSGKRSPAFICKVRVTLRPGEYSRVQVSEIKIVRPNMWHKMESMMSI